MIAAPISVADHLAVAQQVAHSHHLLDDRRWNELVDDVFTSGADGPAPWADFGFDRWVGRAALRAGYAASMADIETAVHATSNLLLTADGDGVVRARYVVQGWHWLRLPDGVLGAARPADFLVLARMTDRFVDQDGSWRLAERMLQRLGPDVAVGALPAWLSGLGAARPPTAERSPSS